MFTCAEMMWCDARRNGGLIANGVPCVAIENEFTLPTRLWAWWMCIPYWIGDCGIACARFVWAQNVVSHIGSLTTQSWCCPLESMKVRYFVTQIGGSDISDRSRQNHECLERGNERILCTGRRITPASWRAATRLTAKGQLELLLTRDDRRLSTAS